MRAMLLASFALAMLVLPAMAATSSTATTSLRDQNRTTLQSSLDPSWSELDPAVVYTTDGGPYQVTAGVALEMLLDFYEKNNVDLAQVDASAEAADSDFPKTGHLLVRENGFKHDPSTGAFQEYCPYFRARFAPAQGQVLVYNKLLDPHPRPSADNMGAAYTAVVADGVSDLTMYDRLFGTKPKEFTGAVALYPSPPSEDDPRTPSWSAAYEDLRITFGPAFDFVCTDTPRTGMSTLDMFVVGTVDRHEDQTQPALRPADPA